MCVDDVHGRGVGLNGPEYKGFPVIAKGSERGEKSSFAGVAGEVSVKG